VAFFVFKVISPSPSVPLTTAIFGFSFSLRDDFYVAWSGLCFFFSSLYMLPSFFKMVSSPPYFTSPPS